METSDTLSYRLAKGKRLLEVSSDPSFDNDKDENSDAEIPAFGPKKPRVVSCFNDGHVASAPFFYLKNSATGDVLGNSHLNDQKQNVSSVQTSPLFDTNIESSSNSRETKLVLTAPSSTVTPFRSTSDLKVMSDGETESVIATSSSLVELDSAITHKLTERCQSQISSAYKLSKMTPVSVTPHPSSVHLREVMRKVKEPVLMEYHSPKKDTSVSRDDDASAIESRLKMTVQTDEPKKITGKKGARRMFVLFAWLLLVLLYFFRWNARPVLTSENTVFVPGAGFSGFWYTLGKLRSIPSPFEKEFYCYSSGCLAVVTILRNLTVDEVYDKARAVQVRWQEGHLHRYEVVASFIDDLLRDDGFVEATNATEFDATSLFTVNIITSIHRGGPILASEIRRAETLNELKTMLLQTTWIPFAVGASLWHNSHMDGAFSAHQHPLCALEVGLPWNFDMVTNAVNVNLGKDKVEKFYNMGLEHGF